MIARRIAQREETTVLALPTRREMRPVLVPEVMPDARRRHAPEAAVEVIVPPVVAWPVDPYRRLAPASGQLIDVYG
jgi:hypothetical protein